MKITVRIESYLSKGFHKSSFTIVVWSADKANITPFYVEDVNFSTKAEAQRVAKSHAIKKLKELYPEINLEEDVKFEYVSA